MQSDPKTLAYYDASVMDYLGMVTADTPDRDLTEFMDDLPPAGCILDLGCGPGHLALLMQKSGFSVFATDISPEMVKEARKHGVDAHVAGFEALSDKAQYDGIWANFSLLHADKADLPLHLAAIRIALRDDGVFHIGMKRGNGQRRDRLGRRYAYYSVAELKELLGDAGFTPYTCRTGETKSMTGDTDPFVIIRARADA